MKYLSLFSGIGTGEQGIEQAFSNKYESAKPEQADSTSGRFGAIDKRGDVLSANESALCDRGGGARRMLENIGYAEIDKTASAIYRYHWSEHTNLGDATAD